MRRIWPLVFAIACKDREAPKPSEPPSAPAAAAAHTATPKPALPPEPPDAGSQAPGSLEQAFDAEPVDTAWKPATEHAIKERVPAARDIECHQSQCRLTIVGTQREISAAIDQMQSAKSLRGIARNVVLTAPAKQADGKLALRAYAQFERDEPH